MKEMEILITQTELKTERGWTRKLIIKYYPTPHKIKPNSDYRGSSPIKLFSLKRIIEIEASNNFALDKAKAVKRQKTQAEVVKKKKETLLEKISKLDINVPKHEKEELFKLGIEHYEDLRYSRKEGDKIAYEMYNDDEFIYSKAVNFLWFNCTGYLSYLEELYGRVGNVEAKVLLLKIIFNAIKKQYPFLSSQCDEKCRFKIEEIGASETSFRRENTSKQQEYKEEQFEHQLDYDFTFNKFFTPEKDLQISIQPKVTINHTRWHGAIINELKETLEQHGFKVANNQNCDLYVFDGEIVIAVFEAKTKVSFQTLSTAIGQLILYTSKFDYPCKQYILLPHLPSQSIQAKLQRLQIEVITFRKAASKILISNFSFIEHLKTKSENGGR